MGLGLLFGLGLIGMVAGLRVTRPSLDAVLAAMAGPPVPRMSVRAPLPVVIGRTAGDWLVARSFTSTPWWSRVSQCLEITGTSLDELLGNVVLAGGAGAVALVIVWVAAAVAGLDVPSVVLFVLTLGLAVTAALTPVAEVVRRARRRQRHVRAVVSSFVDLVVLELAGGTGVEGALFSAAQVSPDWAAKRMARALLTARESGTPSWLALAGLGEALGVPELGELSTTLQLAGTEGARVRQSLQARASSLRRHEQADEESAANAMTERLFVPGSLLLIGFLLFVGYPAFTRIVGGI
jgi:hypothetical protein